LTSISPFLNQFWHDPFGTLNTLDLSFHGFQVNVFRDDGKLRTAILEIFVVIPLICWVLCGTDSTADQLANLILNIPNYLVGTLTLPELFAVYESWYGLGTHWSAAVIYGLLFVGISHHLQDTLDVWNSENVAITAGLTGLTIFAFELFWWCSYYVWQGQTWILSLWLPQLRLVMTTTFLSIPGFLVVLGLDRTKYRLNVDKRMIACAVATVGCILVWWYYPFTVTSLTVGTWTSSPHFPQTMYTLHPYQLFYVANDGVHFLNNLTKIAMTLTFYHLFKIQRRNCNE